MADVTITRTNNVVTVTAASGTIVARGSVAPLAADPDGPYEGQVWFNTTSNELKYYDGSATVVVGDAAEADNADTLDGQHGTYYLARSNHTGSQAISTVAGLQAALNSQDVALDAGLAGKSDLGHDHTESDISDLAHYSDDDANAAIDARVDKAYVDALDVDADTLDGQEAAAFAGAAHDHDDDYAPVAHAHDGTYSPVGHDHDDDYDAAGTAAAEAAAAVSTHAAAADPHTGYQRESEKGQASGYAALDGDGRVPTGQLGSGTADDTVVLRGDGVWASLPDPEGGGVTDHGALTGVGDDDHTIYLKADGTRALTGNLAAGGNKVTGLADGTADTDAATKGQVDAAVADVSAAGHDHDGDYDAAGTAAGAVSTHEGAADPHPGYLLESGLTKAAVDALDVDADTVDGAEASELRDRATHTGTQTASTISDFNTQVRTSRLDQMAAPTSDVSVNSQRVIDVDTPTAASDAATKGYVDDNVGAVLTDATLPSPIGDSDAGVGDSGEAARADHVHPWDGLATDAELAAHQSGSPHVSLSSSTPASLGSAAAGNATTSARGNHVHGMPRVDQLQDPSAARSMNSQRITGLADPTSAQDAATKAYVDTAVDAANPTDGGAHYEAVGDGSATEFTVTHGLGTKNVLTEVFSTVDGDTVIVDVVRSTVDAVTVTFAEPPDADEFGVLVSTGAGSAGGGGGVTDHGDLTGLAVDDHTIYALADGSRGTFASTAQGTLADSAVQPGDGVSDLTNDAGYKTAVSEGDVTQHEAALTVGQAQVTDLDVALAGKEPVGAVHDVRRVWRGQTLGVNAAGGEFTPGTIPGSLYTNYFYPGFGAFRYLWSRGVNVARVPFLWERICDGADPTSDAFDAARILELDAVCDAAAQAGVGVLLDMHNYGRVQDGGEQQVTVDPYDDHFVEMWRLLAARYKDHPAVVGYGLMNEPHDLTGGAAAWETVTQAAVDAIRGEDPSTFIWVGTHHWSGIAEVANEHASGPWITGHVAVGYEVHCYFDPDNSGNYDTGSGETYAASVSDAEGDGYTAGDLPDALYTKHADLLDDAVAWADGARLFLGEFGWPNTADGDQASWAAFGGWYLDQLSERGIDAAYWSAHATGGYNLAAYEELWTGDPDNYTATSIAATLEARMAVRSLPPETVRAEIAAAVAAGGGGGGEDGPQGPPGLVWRGAWDGGTSYAADDAVSHDGRSWVALQASTGVTPPTDSTSTAYWSLLADSGTDGAGGVSGTDVTESEVLTGDGADGTEWTSINVVVPRTHLVVAADDSPAAFQRGADYVCDGTDDSSELNTAIDAGVKHIQLTPGTFVGYNTFLDQSDLTLAGSGIGRTVLQLASTAPDSGGTSTTVLRTPSSGTIERVTVRDLTIDGNKDAWGAGSGFRLYGLYIGTSTGAVRDVRIHRVEIRDCKSYAFDILGAERVSLHDCVASNNGYDSGSENGAAGFDLYGDDLQVVGCRSINNPGGQGFQIGNSDAVRHRTRLTGCLAEGNAGYGFMVSENCEDTVIADGHSYNNGGAGIYVQSGTRAVVHGMLVEGNGSYGIRLNQASRMVVADNVVRGNNQGSGTGIAEIAIRSSSVKNVVQGNNVTPTGVTDWAIREWSGESVDYNLIANNVVTAGDVDDVVVSGANSVESGTLVVPA